MGNDSMPGLFLSPRDSDMPAMVKNHCNSSLSYTSGRALEQSAYASGRPLDHTPSRPRVATVKFSPRDSGGWQDATVTPRDKLTSQVTDNLQDSQATTRSYTSGKASARHDSPTVNLNLQDSQTTTRTNATVRFSPSRSPSGERTIEF